MAKKASVLDLEKELKRAKAKLINKAHNNAADLVNARALIDKVERYKIRGSKTKRGQRLRQQINLINNKIDKLGAKQERRKYQQFYSDLRHDVTDGIPNRLLRMAACMGISDDELKAMIDKYGLTYLSNCSGDELYRLYINDYNPIYKGSNGKYYYDIDEIRNESFDDYNSYDYPFI